MVNTEQLQTLHDYPSSPHFNEDDRLVLALADAMARSPVEVPDELFARLRERFSEAQMVELIGAIAWEHYRARFNRALGVESDNFSEGAFGAFPARLPPS